MNDAKAYVPINCSFYDYLEEAATLGTLSTIHYSNNQEIERIEAKVLTLFIRDKVEYMKLDNNKVIRLDRLISFNGKTLPKKC